MKKFLLLLAIIAFAASANAAEPLLLEPLNPALLPAGATSISSSNGQVMVHGQNGEILGTYVPNLGENMVPQNAAAEGKPVPVKDLPRVRIQTKQGRQTNTQWNPGGKGTKSFF